MIDKFNENGWTVVIRNENAITIKNCFENVVKTSKKPNLINLDDGEEFPHKIFTDLLNKNKNRRYRGYTSRGAVFAEEFHCINKDLLKKPFFPIRN